MHILYKIPPEFEVAQTMFGSLVFTRNVEIKIPEGKTLNEFGAWLVTNASTPFFSGEEILDWVRNECDATWDDVQALMGKPSKIKKTLDAVYCYKFLLPEGKWIGAPEFGAKIGVGQNFLIATTKEFTVLEVLVTKPDERILKLKDTLGNRFSLLLAKDIPFGILRRS